MVNINSDIYDLDVAEDGVECKCATFVSIDFTRKKHLLRVCLDECVYEVGKKIVRCLNYDFVDADDE